MTDLTTLATAKAWLAVTGTGDDALLTRLVSAVSAAAQQRMGRQIASQSYTDTRNGTDKMAMAFPTQPVTAVASVTVDGIAIPARPAPGQSGYTFDAQLIRLVGYSFTRGVQNVVLVYTAGYAATPTDLEQAVVEIVAHKYKERDRIGQTSKVLAGETVSFLRDVPVDALRVIDQYRRIFDT